MCSHTRFKMNGSACLANVMSKQTYEISCINRILCQHQLNYFCLRLRLDFRRYLHLCCSNTFGNVVDIISRYHIPIIIVLTHWGRVTHICVVKLTITGSDNGLSPGRRQTIIWTNAGILLIGPLRTNFSEILFGIQTSSFEKMHLKMSSVKFSW